MFSLERMYIYRMVWHSRLWSWGAPWGWHPCGPHRHRRPLPPGCRRGYLYIFLSLYPLASPFLGRSRRKRETTTTTTYPRPERCARIKFALAAGRRISVRTLYICVYRSTLLIYVESSPSRWEYIAASSEFGGPQQRRTHTIVVVTLSPRRALSRRTKLLKTVYTGESETTNALLRKSYMEITRSRQHKRKQRRVRREYERVASWAAALTARARLPRLFTRPRARVRATESSGALLPTERESGSRRRRPFVRPSLARRTRAALLLYLSLSLSLSRASERVIRLAAVALAKTRAWSANQLCASLWIRALLLLHAAHADSPPMQPVGLYPFAWGSRDSGIIRGATPSTLLRAREREWERAYIPPPPPTSSP